MVYNTIPNGIVALNGLLKGSKEDMNLALRPLI